MDSLEESIKNERRRILSSLENWNVGITPNGKLATESCFVHSSVPDIVFNKNKETIIESTFISTKSERAINLVQSSASNPCDTETIKSLSVCNSIFRTSLHHAATIAEEEKEEEAIHLIKHSVKAYVIVDNVARLTKEFDDELTKAQEHWPHNPQKSWDKLYLIWNRYGFLWPKRIQIGFKIHESIEINKEEKERRRQDEIITSIKDHLEKKSQGTLLHSPKNYSVIWRTQLGPMHEFFPAPYDEKREFINTIIHHFSTLVFSDSLIRLKNVKSGEYLGRYPLQQQQQQQQQSHYRHDDHHLDSLSNVGVTTISNNGNNNTTSSNSLWKFNDCSNSTANGSYPYVFAGSEKYLCSGQYGTTGLTFLNKSSNSCQQPQLQLNSIDRYNGSQSRASINLVQYKQQKSKSRDMEENWKWSIDFTSPKSHYVTNGVFELDKAIYLLRCLVHGDEIVLSQQSMYLRTAADLATKDYVSSISSSLTYNSPIPQGIYAKSPLSVSSFGAGDRYKFSSSSDSSSNGTQPTSGTNSFYTPTLKVQQYNIISNKNKPFYVNNPKQSSPPPPQNATSTPPLVYIENKVISSTQTINNLSAAYRWKIEMVSKSMISEKKKKQEGDTITKNLVIKSNDKTVKEEQNNEIINNSISSNSIKPYIPKLSLDITRCSTPDTTTNAVSDDGHTQNHQVSSSLSTTTTANKNNNIIGVSSMIPDEDYYENLNQVLIQQQQYPKSHQQQQHHLKLKSKSKWLDVNTKFYNLGARAKEDHGDDNNDVDNQQQSSIRTSQYETPMEGSIKSITSPAASFVPAATTSDEMMISEKKFGKQPLQQGNAMPVPKVLLPMAAKFDINKNLKDSGDGSDSCSWSSLSQSSSATTSPINKSISIKKSTPATSLTEAETFKRGIQKTYQEQANAHKMIFKNLFSSSSSCASPKSSTTSQIRYYDDDEEEEEEDDQATEILDPASSQLRTYTMTPRSHRFFSQPTTPSSSAFLTPEEYMKRKRSRENSFMLLLNQETKQQMWLRAIKQSTLSHWLRVLSKGTKKLHQKSMILCSPPPPTSSSSKQNNRSYISSNHHFLNTSSDIRLQHHHNSHSNRVIQKKKGFYFKKKSKSNSSRRQRSIVL